MDCPFCEIAAENPVPTTPGTFMATDHVLAFLDVQPLVDSRAHVLVIPRKHFRTLDEMAADPAAAEALGLWVPRVAKAVLAATGGTAFNVIQNNGQRAGQVVDHVHFHIVVRDSKNVASDVVQEMVLRVRQEFDLLDRVAFSARMYGKGQRQSLDESHLVQKLRSSL